MEREPRLTAGIVLAFGDIYEDKGHSDELVDPIDQSIIRFDWTRSSPQLRMKPVILAISAGSQRCHPEKPVQRVALADQMVRYTVNAGGIYAVPIKIGEYCWGTMAEVRNGVKAIKDPRNLPFLPKGEAEHGWSMQPSEHHFIDFVITADNDLHKLRIAWACYAQHDSDKDDYLILNRHAPLSGAARLHERIKLVVYRSKGRRRQAAQRAFEVPQGLMEALRK